MAREMTTKAQEAIASALQAASAAGNPQDAPRTVGATHSNYLEERSHGT